MSETNIETTQQLKHALDQVRFVNTVLDFKWEFEYESIWVETCKSRIGRQGWLLWVTFERPDTRTGEVGRGRGRDEIIWKGSSLSGVIKTAWLLVELMVRHELMEGFQWDGARIFNPHHSVDELRNAAITHDTNSAKESK